MYMIFMSTHLSFFVTVIKQLETHKIVVFDSLSLVNKLEEKI